MITSPRRRALSTPVHRPFEFTRLQSQSIACAYEALIPLVSRRRNGRTTDRAIAQGQRLGPRILDLPP